MLEHIRSLPEDILRLFISIILGMIMGLEREYRGKVAGIRMITLISFGACIFTLLSQKIGGNSPDRIAANIVTGVGFLGGGVIFKEGFNVSGLTTAATIWLAAALGMAAASDSYLLAFSGLGMAIIILSTFEYLRDFVEFIRESRNYRISFYNTLFSYQELEESVHKHGIKFKKKKISRNEELVEVIYEIYGSEQRLDKLNEWLYKNPNIHSFDH